MFVPRRGVTILEVLVAVILCAIVVGLAVMLLARHRENAQVVQCRNNLREIGRAIHTYHDNSSADKTLRRLPPSRIDAGYATWAVAIMPHLVKDHPLQKWDLQRPYVAQADDVRQAAVILYLCPTRQRDGMLSSAGDIDATGKHFPGAVGDYAAVAGDGADNGLLRPALVARKDGERILEFRSQSSLASCKRGTSYTLMVGEKHVPPEAMGDAAFGDGSLYNGAHPASYSRYAGPGIPLADSIDAPYKRQFGSQHRNVCQFLMADGSFRTMSNSTSEAVLGELTRTGD